MKIVAKKDRKLLLINTGNTQNENKIETIELTVPEEYEDYNKKIVFVTDNGIVWDIIQDNTYKLTKAITKYKQVDFYIWLTKGDVDFRTETRPLRFYYNKDASGEITPEEISGVNTVVNILEEEITKVDSLETELRALITDIQNKLDNGEFDGKDGKDGRDGEDGKDGQDGKDAKINGKNAIEIEAGENITIDDTERGIRINSKGGGSGGTLDYTDLENKPKINNVELNSNKSLNDLGIQPAGDYVAYERTRNICDTKIELGSLSSSTGVPISSTTKTRAQDYIPVLPNTQYTFTDYAEQALNVAIYGYDNNKIFIGSITNKGSSSHYKTFTTQNDCAYIRFWILSDDISQKYQIELGSVSTNYIVSKTMNIKETDLSPELAEKINNSLDVNMNHLYVDSSYDNSTEGYGVTKFSNIYDANAFITDNSEEKQYTIHVADGTYTDLQEKYSGSTGSELEGIIAKDYVYYIGNEKNPSNCIIKWDGATGLTNPLYSDVTKKAPFHIANVINKSLHTKISGFKIEGINLRYAIHIETASVGGDVEWEISNMVIDWKGIPGAPTQESLRGTNGYKPAIGAGHTPNEKGIIKNCNITCAMPSATDPIGIGYLGHNNYNYSGYSSEIVSGANITIENVNFNNSKISLLTTRNPNESPSLINTLYVLNLKNVTNLKNVEQTSSFDSYAWSVKWLEHTYSKPSGGIPKTDLESSVQTSLGKADTALQSHQDISGKQDITDNNLTTNNKTITGAINEINSIAKGANQALSYGNYSTMITAFNSLENDVYNVGQNVMIITLEVPDLWISGIESTSSSYSYVDDETFANELKTNGYVQVGYYKLSALETQKVDLTNYVENTDYANASTGGTFKTSNAYGQSITTNGQLFALTKTYDEYISANNALFISKGTLENVLRGYRLIQ